MVKRITNTQMGVCLEILSLLEKEPRQSPDLIEERLEYSLSSVSTALVYLKDMSLVKRVSRGLYVITELGKYVLHHPLNVNGGEE